MKSILGITGKDFVLVGFSQNEGRSILVMKSDQEKMYPLSKNVVMLSSGEGPEAQRFSQYVQRDYHLYTIRNGFDLPVESVAKLTRSEIARSLRTRVSVICLVVGVGEKQKILKQFPQRPALVNALIAGVDSPDKPAELYWIDYLGSLVKMPYASHGYASYFTFSIMDKYWKPEIKLEEAMEIMKKCIKEIQKRFQLQQPNFKVRVVNKEGTRDVTIEA